MATYYGGGGGRRENMIYTPFYLCLLYQVFPTEAPNNTKIDEVIKKAADNDGELMEINLNNLKFISRAKWEDLFK
jgi:hypothetical protein